MNEKKILWIDDWPAAMNNMLSSVFHKLWEKEIKSEIAIFGNAALDEYKYEQDVQKEKTDNLNKAAYSEFVAYLLSKNDLDEDKLDKYISLISTKEYEDFLKEPNSNIASDLYEKFKPIYEKYNSKEANYDEIGKAICEQLNFMEYGSILLDLRLTAYDNLFHKSVYGLLEDGEDFDSEKPLFSMIIYNYISKKPSKQRPKVFLYSTYTEPIDFTKQWKKQYKGIYKDDENIEIFNRNGKEISGKNKNLVDEILPKEGKENAKERKKR